jgi:hypothetical protein
MNEYLAEMYGTNETLKLTKTADAEMEKLAEQDFLGRVMAHAYVNELKDIEKSAAAEGDDQEKKASLEQKAIEELRAAGLI